MVQIRPNAKQLAKQHVQIFHIYVGVSIVLVGIGYRKFEVHEFGLRRFYYIFIRRMHRKMCISLFFQAFHLKNNYIFYKFRKTRVKQNQLKQLTTYERD